MSALSMRGRLTYRLYVYVRSLSRLEHSTLASREIDTDSNSETHKYDEPKIPLVPKRRDPDAVLKALQSTVGPVKHPMLIDGRSIADPLAPFSGRIQHMEYVRTRESGRAAARYVINKWPKMFPRLEAGKEERKGEIESEERLKWLVSDRRTDDSIQLYQQLKEKNIEVSLEVANELLALLAYEGVGNTKSSKYDTAQQFINWPPKGKLNERNERKETDRERALREAEQEALKDMESLYGDSQSEKHVKRYTSSKSDDSGDSEFSDILVWSSDNSAEQMFAEMEDKDGGSYDAMIQGLVKHRNYCRAFELFTEMRDQKLQANLGTYNVLLDALANSDDSAKLMPRAKLLINEMNYEPIVQPDITTMNHMLSACLSAKCDRRQVASEVLREITHLGQEPTLTTFARLLKAFTLSGEGHVLYEIVDYLEQNPHTLHPHTESDLSFFLEASYTTRLLCDAELATRVKRLASKDHYFLVNNLNFFLSHYLVTIAANGDIEQLKQECADLIPNTLLPYEWVYGIMFRACEEAQSPEFGLQLWKDMTKYRVPIFNAETIERFCGAISSRIHPPDAPEYIKALQRAWDEVEHKKMRPPVYLISQSVRMNVLNNDLESAWHYYDYFKKYDYPPMFLALTVLLKAHYAIGDKEKMVEIMEVMIERKNVLPLSFIKKLCYTSNIDKNTRNRLLNAFTENAKDREVQRSQKKWDSHKGLTY